MLIVSWWFRLTAPLKLWSVCVAASVSAERAGSCVPGGSATLGRNDGELLQMAIVVEKLVFLVAPGRVVVLVVVLIVVVVVFLATSDLAS